MNFEEALYYLENSSYGHNNDNQILKEALNLLEISQDDFKIIQIAGTNGKGTVGTFLSYFISLNDVKVGHFSSPHLEDYRERFKINNNIIDKNIFVDYVEYIKRTLPIDLKDNLTYFEISFIVALTIFKKEKVEYLVIESGIGGRFDITNLFKENILSIITTIDYDHMNILGDNLKKIAYHKAGIIKFNSKVVTFRHDIGIDEILINESKIKNSNIEFLDLNKIEILEVSLKGTVFKYKDCIYQTPMIGRHQGYNISLALLAYSTLGFEMHVDIIKKLLKNIKFEGRMEIINEQPLVIVDGAHNSEGLKTLHKNIEEMHLNNYVLVIGSMNDKDIYDNINKLIEKACFVIFTKIDYDRAIEPESLIKLINIQGKYYKIITNLSELKRFILDNFIEENVFITGSLYLVGEIKKEFNNLRN